MSETMETLQVSFLDTTLRDGAQALPEQYQFPEGSKPEVAHNLATLGVDTIEAGFPQTPGDAEEVHDVATTVGRTDYTVTPRSIENDQLINGEPRIFTPVITGLSRATPRDVETTWAAVQAARRPGIHTFVPTAPDHMAAKFPDKTPEQVAQMAAAAVAHARAISTPETVVEFSAEAAFTTDPAFLERVVRDAIQSGADVINLPDTVGQGDPWSIAEFFKRAAGWVIKEGVQDKVILSAHNHNDGGMATVNTLAAMRGVAAAAAEHGTLMKGMQVETTIGGNLGERAGNTAMAEVVMGALLQGREFPVRPHMEIDTTRLVPVARFVFGTVGMEIPPRTPIIGADAIVHRSGVHADGVVKGGASIYGPFDGRWVGHDAAAVIQGGKYQGKRGNEHIGAVATY